MFIRNELQYPRWGMLHTAAEGETATKGNTEGGEGTGDGGMGVGGGGRKWGGS